MSRWFKPRHRRYSLIGCFFHLCNGPLVANGEGPSCSVSSVCALLDHCQIVPQQMFLAWQPPRITMAIAICHSSVAYRFSRHFATFLLWLRPSARPLSHIHALEPHPTHEQWKSATPLILLAMPPLLCPLAFQAMFIFTSFHLRGFEYWFQSFPTIFLLLASPIHLRNVGFIDVF